MYVLSESPVKEVTLGRATNITLDNYYDLLKAQVGGLATEEYLQLKLVADTLDLSDKGAADGGYKWYSYYNMLNRSDLSIQPAPTTGQVQTAVAELSQVYGKFLLKLRQYVVTKNLTPDEQITIANLDVKIELLRAESIELRILDVANWKKYAEALGFKIGDTTAYVQWSGTYGHLREIEQKSRAIQIETFKKRTVLDRQYKDPEDRRIVEAEFNFDNPAMRLRYPIFPDYEYASGAYFSLEYLALLPPSSTGQFDDRRVVGWDKTISTIKTEGVGAFTAELSGDTADSSSITTDWKASGSARYGFIKVSVSASEHKQIAEDFSKAKKLTLDAKATFRVGITYPDWFDATLFEQKHVKENIYDFEEFFGENGTLLYYPTHLIIVRGFGVTFESTQNWTYDYKKRFSASGGGGFNAFGVNFGASTSYSKNEKIHRVDKSTTKLSIGDDETTLRFVGYAVKKNTVYQEAVEKIVDVALASFADG